MKCFRRHCTQLCVRHRCRPAYGQRYPRVSVINASGLRRVRLAHQRVNSRRRGQESLGFRVHQSGRCVAQFVDLGFLGRVHEEYGMRVFRKAQGSGMNTGRSSDGWHGWRIESTRGTSCRRCLSRNSVHKCATLAFE